MIKDMILIIFLSLSLFLSGCNPLVILPNTNRERIAKEEFDSYVQWRNEELKKLQSYIGFKKEEINALFGKPDRIITYSSGEFWDFNHYQQKRKVGFFRFYFEQEKVVKVDIR